MSSGGDIQTSSSSSSLNNEDDVTANTNATNLAATTSATVQAQSVTPELKVENNPDAGIWITSQGVFYFKLNTLHVHLQFFYSTLRELDRVIDIDALYYLLCCLKLLILNDECLETAAKDNRGFLSYCLEKLLVPHIWKILALGHGHLNECCVPLLLHALNYEPGKTALWNILERDFSNTHWKVRSSAGTRVIALYSLLKPKLIKNNYNVLSVLAYAFLNLITSIEDIEPTVSQKAMCSLETLGDASFKTVMCALEFQFDTVISDRSIILHRLSKLYTILLRNNSAIKILSWEFFLNRFDTLSIESQISMEESGEFMSPQSIGGFNTESEHFIRKLNQIRFAMARTDSIKPISTSLRFSSRQRRTNVVHEKTETDSIGSFSPDTDNSDTSTLQLLLNLLMKFMMKDDQNQVNDDRIMLKQQNVVIRHVCSLLGYNQTNRTFVNLPSKIRRTPVFHAFLSNLPKVLDYNFNLGTVLLPFFLSFLQFSTCSNASVQFYEHIAASNTLGRIDPSLRNSWLMILIIILYKYQYSTFSNTIQHLTRIAMNTILSHYHQCETPPFGITSGGLSGRITPKVAGSRRGSSRPFDDIREIELNELGTRYDFDGDTQSESASIVENKRFRLLSPPKKVKPKLFKPEIECFDEPLTIRQTEENMGSSGRSYTGFLKSLFTSSGPAGASGSTLSASTGMAPSLPSMIPSEKLTEIDGKGMKGVKELSRVVYSTERGKLETVLLKPGASSTGTKEESPPKVPKATSLSSSTLASMGGPATGGKLKPSFHGKKGKFKDESNVRSPTLSRPTRTSTSQAYTKAIGGIASGAKRATTTTTTAIDEFDNAYADTDLHNQFIAVPKCDKCGQAIEYYSEECIGHCIIVCETLVHREPAIAAPLLMDMIETVGRVAASHIYTWQENSTVIAPANSRSIAQQFIRCTFQQLAANNISYQFFQQNFRDEKLLHTIALSLNDFPEFNSIIALKWLLNDMNKQKSFSLDICTTLLSNIAQFMEYIPIDSPIQLWTSVFLEFDFLFDKLTRVYATIKSSTPITHELTPILRIMMNILKVPYIANVRLVLDPFSKLLTFILQNGTFQLEHIIELCSLSNRTFTRDREKFLLPRTIVNVLVEAMLHRYPCPDRNLLLMIQLILLDAGGTIYASAIVSDDVRAYDPHNVVTTNGAECMKHYLNETVAFIADIHTITKIKSTMKEKSEKQQLSNLTEDTLGGQLKAGLAQYLALEFTKGGQRDAKAIVRFLPWLYNPPTSVQQGAKDFVDCIDRIRFLSWLMIGSLTHAAITRNEGTIICHPIPVDASQSIADYILYILTGFADQSKTSVIHMSSLFHSFILCQLWTMYCEQVNRGHDPEALVAIMDFWARITPGILHLLSHSKVLAEMVNLHFLSLIEALQEINSIVLANLFAMWVPVLYTHQSQLPAHVQVRLQTCLNHQPSSETQGDLRFMYGRCWSVIFARAKQDVFLFDTMPSMLETALSEIGLQLEQLNRFDLLFKQTTTDILKRIQTIDTNEKLNELFRQGVDHVQECIPEDLEIKTKLFLQLDENVPANTIIASSSSCIMPSKFTEKMKTRNRCIVAHPINPPTTIPLVEIIGTPWTDETIVDLAIERYRSFGMEPIRLKKEVDGFVVNRLQYALLSSALQLVQDGVATPEDVDRAITHGLACRWSFMGPFQTIDLNAPKGIIDYFDRYGSSMQRVLTDMHFPSDWTQETVEKVDQYFRSKYPVGENGSGINEKKNWRDQRLLDLAKHKQTYVDRDYRIVRYPLTIPKDQGQGMIQAIENELKQVYKQVKIRKVSTDEANNIDFSSEPWNLAASSLGNNGIFCQLGGAKNVELQQGHSVRFDIASVLNQLNIKNEQTLVIGPGAADLTHLSINGELVFNMTLDQYNKIVTQRSYSSMIPNENDEPCQQLYQPKTCGPFQHIMISTIDRQQSAIMIEIDVQERLNDEHEEENNFISVIRRSLKQYSKEPIALGGIFRIEKGTIKAHVMPDFVNEDLTNKQQVDQWLKFYDMHAPLNCLSVLLTEDINNAGFRLEHSHFFSDHGQSGHYHFDITPKEVHYHGYFILCEEAIIVDPVV
ncbi:hypothetical protein I4U23_006420 [Adineta vaga]|nr:hypothetical protein I4U23_006420 [Adineta vaga]